MYVIMIITFEEMPCYDPAKGPDGVVCGAFQTFVDSEVAAYEPRATDNDGIVAEYEQLFEGLHDRFMDADFCLLARAMRARMQDDAPGVDVSAGLYGQCPPLVGEKPDTPKNGHLRLVVDPLIG